MKFSVIFSIITALAQVAYAEFCCKDCQELQHLCQEDCTKRDGVNADCKEVCHGCKSALLLKTKSPKFRI